MCCRKHNEKSLFQRTFRCICCFSWAARFLRRNPVTSRKENAQRLTKLRLLVTKQEESEKITEYFRKREQKVQRQRTYVGPFYGSFTREVLQD